MPLYTEKTMEEALRPLSQYSGDDAFVKGQIYSLGNGGDMYRYSNNLKSYNKALEDAKANDNDNFWTGLGDFFVGRGADKLKADMADQYVSAFSSNPYEFAGDDYNNNVDKIRTEQDFGQGRAFNGGLIGSLINPITQVGKAGADLGAGIGGNWDAWNKRDHLSDIGALGETALTLAPIAGAGVKALKGGGAIAKAGANTLGKTILKGAGYGAGYGLAGGLKDMGSENFDGGQLALNTLLGGAIGGGLAGAGYGLGKVWNKYSQPAPSKSTDLIPYSGGANTNSTAYQDALNTLKGYGLDSNDVSGTLKKAYHNASRATHPDKGGSQAAFETIQDAYNVLNGKSGATKATTAPIVTTPNLSFGEKLRNFGSNIPNMGKDLANTKAGTKVANLLKTKKGKVLAGAGGGLLLAQLMKNNNNNNSNSGELTDEELQELYNYVYGGGE